MVSPNHKKNLDQLKEVLPRSQLLKELINASNNAEACRKLNLSVMLFRDLMKHYKIEEDEYRTDRAKKKWLQEYDAVVNLLGRHPSTAELQGNTDWKAIYYAISRVWGTFEQFRREFGIQTIGIGNFADESRRQAWQDGLVKAREIRTKRKEERKKRILNLLQSSKPIGTKELKKHLDITGSCLNLYLHELLEDHLIQKVGTGKYLELVT